MMMMMMGEGGRQEQKGTDNHNVKPEIRCPIYWIRLDGSSTLLDENACLHSSNKLERFLYNFLISSCILRTSVSLQQSSGTAG